MISLSDLDKIWEFLAIGESEVHLTREKKFNLTSLKEIHQYRLIIYISVNLIGYFVELTFMAIQPSSLAIGSIFTDQIYY